MKQVKLDNILWVLQPEPYKIKEDTDSENIMVNCNTINEFRILNPDLNLTPWNYRILTKFTLPYYEYLDDKEHSNFYFEENTQNYQSYIDEDITVNLQKLVLPEDLDIEPIYKLGDDIISGDSFTLTEAGQYVITATLTGSEIYEDFEASYIINYTKEKRTATLSFANSVVEETVEDVAEYSGQIQTVSEAPNGVQINYYLGDIKLNSNNITLSTSGNYTITAKIENDTIYNDTQVSYTFTLNIINYQKWEFLSQPNYNKFSIISLGNEDTLRQYYDTSTSKFNHLIYDNNEQIFQNYSTVFSDGIHEIKIPVKTNTCYINTQQLSVIGSWLIFNNEKFDVVEIPKNINTIIWADKKDWGTNNTGMKQLKTIIIKNLIDLNSTTVPADLNPKCKIYVPIEYEINYKTKWQNLSSQIFGTDFSKKITTLRVLLDDINISTYVDENYTGQIQHIYSSYNTNVNNHLNYYLDGVKLNSNSITLTTAGNHTVTAKIENDSVYNDAEVSYTINYTKEKRTATLSFANQEVTEKINQDFVSDYYTYSGQVQEVVGAPNGVKVNYYLDNTLLTNGEINISDLKGLGDEVREYNYTITAKIENDPVYNDAEASYTLNIVVKAETPAFNFPDQDVYETVNDVTNYTGQVQEASGIIEGANHNYYLGNTLLTNGEINISDLQEGENTYTITCKIENDPVWSDLSASYKLHITRIITPYENQYFTIESKNNNNTISFKCSKEDIPRTILVSTDNGNTWSEKTSTTSGVELATLNEGDILRIKGENMSYAQSSSIYNMFVIQYSSNVYGNIMSLIYGDNFKNKTEFPENSTYNFARLFSSSKSIISAENLILPATTLTNSCYSYMFNFCSNLSDAPQLPATTLTDYCYSQMFRSCSKLTTAPELPATTLANQCYQSMFNGCSKLNYIKAMFTTTPSNSYTLNWVSDVSSTGTFVKSSEATWDETGVNGIPEGWTVETITPNEGQEPEE